MLKNAGNYLQNNPFGLAVVAAYTDMKGDTEKDRLLSEARAMVVRDYLVRNFKLDDTRIKTIGVGKSDKAAEGGSVDVLIYARHHCGPGAVGCRSSGSRLGCLFSLLFA